MSSYWILNTHPMSGNIMMWTTTKHIQNEVISEVEQENMDIQTYSWISVNYNSILLQSQTPCSLVWVEVIYLVPPCTVHLLPKAILRSVLTALYAQVSWDRYSNFASLRQCFLLYFLNFYPPQTVDMNPGFTTYPDFQEDVDRPGFAILGNFLFAGRGF